MWIHELWTFWRIDICSSYLTMRMTGRWSNCWQVLRSIASDLVGLRQRPFWLNQEYNGDIHYTIYQSLGYIQEDTLYTMTVSYQYIINIIIIKKLHRITLPPSLQNYEQDSLLLTDISSCGNRSISLWGSLCKSVLFLTTTFS